MADPATASRVVATISSIVNDAINIGKGLVIWNTTLKQNPEKLDELLTGLFEVKLFLDRVKEWLSDVPPQPSMRSYRSVVECRLGIALDLHERLQGRVMTDVERANKKIFKVYPSVVKEFLKENQQVLKDLSSEINGIASDVKDFEEAAKENGASAAQDLGDRFKKVTNMVPNNPPGMVMDFDSIENGEPLTPEGKLLAAVRAPATGDSVGAIARGQGGVGKTCALRAIGRHRDIVERFQGGVLYVTMGHGATKLDLIRHIAKMVNHAGGAQKAKSVLQTDELEEAVQIGSEWFQGRTLFLIDDIWARNGITSETIASLSKLAQHEDSLIVYTSRDYALRAGKHIIFEPRGFDDRQCRKILCKHAHIQHEPLTTKAKEAFDEVLKSCGGLPIALAVVGGTIRTFTETRCKENAELAWHEYRSAWHSFDGENMTNRMLLSLEVLDEGRNGCPYRKRYEALCVLRKTQYVPVDVLVRLWDVTVAEAKKTVDKLERVSVTRVVLEEQGEDSKTVVGLHDILLDIARRLAESGRSLTYRSSLLLKSYLRSSELERSASRVVRGITSTSRHEEIVDHQFSEQFRSQWLAIEDDGYIHKNVCWLLRCASMRNDIMWLICQPEWVIKQLKAYGESQSREDFWNARECVKSSMGRTHSDEDDANWLRVLQSAVRLSKKEILSSAWAGMPWFQLYGRLVQLSGTNERVGTFLEEIERHAPRPWLRPSQGCLQSAGGSLREIIKVDGNVKCFVSLGGVIRILEEDSGRLTITDFNVESGDEMERIELCNDFRAMISSGCTEGSDEEKSSEARSAAFSLDGKSLILGLTNSDVITCDGGESRQRCAGNEQYTVPLKWPAIGLRGHADTVLSMSASWGGTHVVSGSSDKTVRVWQKEGGTWSSHALKGHTGEVDSVDISRDGTHVVSGSLAKSVRVWQKEGGTWNSHALEGHTYSVESVSVSQDGSHVASGSSDETVRVWRKANDTWSCCHTEELRVDSLRMSDDGCEIIVRIGSKEMMRRSEGGRWIEVKHEHMMATWRSINILKEEEIDEIKSAMDWKTIEKTASGYVFKITGAPYIVFVDVDLPSTASRD